VRLFANCCTLLTFLPYLSVNKHTALIPHVLAIHTITGCDTAAAIYGIGKSRAVTTSRNALVLDSLGITDAPWEDVEKEVAMFMIAAYGG